MTEGIRWDLLRTAHGNGAHLPEAIKNLAALTDEERRQAYFEIDNYAILQSYMYESAYYVIEPIVQLLEMDYSTDRIYPLRVLAEIALGGSGDTVIALQDTGERKAISRACNDKLKELRKRIAGIVVKTDVEVKEKETIVEAIDEME